jgi:hypothetical protein
MMRNITHMNERRKAALRAAFCSNGFSVGDVAYSDKF